MKWYLRLNPSFFMEEFCFKTSAKGHTPFDPIRLSVPIEASIVCFFIKTSPVKYSLFKNKSVSVELTIKLSPKEAIPLTPMSLSVHQLSIKVKRRKKRTEDEH